MGATVRSDVVIVGAGSAGSVLAERLSVDPDCTVTVLEAGEGLVDPALLSQTRDGTLLPIGAASRLVHRYWTELTETPDRRAAIVRGATVGGSGAVNGGYFCRGLPQDFDAWGVPGWRWSDVLDDFRAIETDHDFDGPAHGGSGPIPVRRVSEMSDNTEAFVAAARRMGFGWIADLNDVGTQPTMSVGVGPVPLNIVDGVRTGPGAGYLLPALPRPNLTLLPATKAVRLRFSRGRAVGVDAVGPDGPVEMRADRIVLCAGAIETAQLLMLSGVGEEHVLRAVGIDVQVLLPVGVSTSDHPEWVLPVDWPAASGKPVLEAVLYTPDDIEIRPYTGGFGAMVGDSSGRQKDWAHVGVALMQPRARGRITLVSADPAVAPRIEHRYDSAAEDVEALRSGVQMARELIGGAKEVGPPIWATSQHLCGSAPMGADHDDGAVVDPQCRVRGIDGLWVADGSVLPRIPSRGPHATIVMLGHRVARFVRRG